MLAGDSNPFAVTKFRCIIGAAPPKSTGFFRQPITARSRAARPAASRPV
jgi:hypothetical protein